MKFSDKLKRCREMRQLSQLELAKKAGLSQRTIAAYESQDVQPRSSNIVKLADALQVSAEYLKNEKMADPQHGAEMRDYVDAAHDRLVNEGNQDVAKLMKKTVALFAGGELSDDARDDYFEAVLHAYQIGKAEARRRREEEKSEGQEN